MIVVSPPQLAALEREAERWHLHRCDLWLKTSLRGWAAVPDGQRFALLMAAAAVAKEARLIQENDIRLLCWLYLALAGQAQAFFAQDEIRQVLAWDVANRGGILHEVYRRAGADLPSVLAVL